MSTLLSFSMLFLSLLPLWISILIIDIVKIYRLSPNIYTEITSFFSILLCFIISIGVFVFNRSKKQTAIKYKIFSVSELKMNTAEYISAYILPILAFNFTLWLDTLLFLIFFFTLFFLYSRHNYFPANIFLELCGYKAFLCKIENTQTRVTIERTIISKDDLKTLVDTEINTKIINNDCLFHDDKNY
ncbi:hypothetical protein II898_10580 [bacterium]|nr:hypothetical protein [bacterium]